MSDEYHTILALDVGAARIGLALANTVAKLANPYGAIVNDGDVLERLRDVCRKESVGRIVIGLPRGMSGQTTQQTEVAQAFGGRVAQALQLPISWQDEAVTSVRAEAELRARDKPYTKGDIDALAATYILEDYLHENV